MDASSFSSVVQELLANDRLCDLGPGRPNEEMRKGLEGLTIENLFAPQEVRRQDFAKACLAALWLYHDFLDESHELSQTIHTIEGSYWHGIMHRREPEYANAAYWFRKVSQHPVFDPLGTAAQELASLSKVAVPLPWNPFWFIDFCEACATGKQSDEKLARLIQKKEWELLFDYCYQKAIG